MRESDQNGHYCDNLAAGTTIDTTVTMKIQLVGLFGGAVYFKTAPCEAVRVSAYCGARHFNPRRLTFVRSS